MAGESTKEISVTISSTDEEDEDIETFTVMLNNQTAGSRFLPKQVRRGEYCLIMYDPSETEIEVEISAVSNSVQEGTPAVFAFNY